ncbi:hypothetical protein CERSUDRAFT_112293 [Gelatoporia subvermispora B]|uniref:Uncharacterized protein n=1 Tax=Ceriporiopsis subvermispora (strain B) TaxID=914234 RepID=M2R665_CERS8|nr:hypothetical protein CERSUDRAFT_112293 [Gelatoporia subvermispora B]
MTRARVIRRVQAVVEVKHESSDDENVPPPPPVRRAPRSVSQGAYVSVDEAGGPEAGEDSGEGSEYEPDKPARAGQRRDSQARAQAARQRRKSAVWAEDQIRRHATAAEAAGAQQEESEDDEEVARVKQRPRPRPPVDSDDDDELLMGPDTSREEHPTQVPKPRASLAKTPASKKRKLDSEHVLHTGRTPATKVARKKP